MSKSVCFKPLEWARSDFSPSCFAKEATFMVSTLGIALIATLGLTGYISPTAVGYSIVILKGCAYFFDLAQGNWQQRKFHLVAYAFVAVSLVTLGSLGAAGVLTIKQMAWASKRHFSCGTIQKS